MENKNTQEYGIRWSQFGRDNRLSTYEKFFSSDSMRQQYVKKLEEKANFHSILAWSDPKEVI